MLECPKIVCSVFGFIPPSIHLVANQKSLNDILECTIQRLKSKMLNFYLLNSYCQTNQIPFFIYVHFNTCVNPFTVATAIKDKMSQKHMALFPI